MEDGKPNGWDQWSRHVLAELRRLADGQEKQTEEIGATRADIAALKVKAGIWGAIGGMLIAGPVLAIALTRLLA